MCSGFVVYPSQQALVVEAMQRAVQLATNKSQKLKSWQKLDIIGFKLDNLIRTKIQDAEFLVADITYPNFNVFYEIGYGIAVGKPVIPTINVAVADSVERAQKIGLFDTIGWATYSNGDELSRKLDDWSGLSWQNKYVRRRDHAQPLFVLDCLSKTDFRNHIFHPIDNSQVNYRKFDPEEIPRLTAAKAIAEISSSAGVVLPLISEEIVDSFRHNLRASFLLGLAHGYEIEALAIQYEQKPAALDYRDFIKSSTYRKETERHVEEYCAKVLVWNQRPVGRDRQTWPGILNQIDLGSPTAENEIQQLGYYFIQTAEFSRALRAESAVVIGRKGSGKTAVFLQIAETVSKDKRVCVVDLRPASHNLSLMRESLLSVISAGVFDHTIAAFWQYVIYVEVLLKIRERVLPKSKNDLSLQNKIRKIEEDFSLSEAVVAGDFTSRLESAVRDVIKTFGAPAGSTKDLGQLTNRMFESPIPKLRESISSFDDQFQSIIVLIDDLDKGWPPRQVEEHDISMIKHLIEVLSRIQRDVRRRNVDLKHLLFLRSDIYERLVEQTSDRGKHNVIKLDWSDPEQLRNLLKQRVMAAVDAAYKNAAWEALNPPMNGGDAVSRMIESSLRRPRFLIDLCERVLSFAINRGHSIVAPEDIDEGMRQMSLYLVSDFGYEMRDLAGTPEDIFYKFIGSPELLTEPELRSLLLPDYLKIGLDETIDLLLWYGFLGVVSMEGETRIFIYDRAYDFRRLVAERPADRTEALYCINPAFLRGLKTTS